MTASDSSAIPPERPQQAFDPFAILGFEPVFELDPRLLRARWMRAAAAVHPDAAGATLLSAKVNDAFRVLSDPLLRAEALLERFGVNVHAMQDVVRRSLPPTFLMEMMELREQIDAIGSDDHVGRSAMRDVAMSRRDAALLEIASAFQRLATTSMDTQTQEQTVRTVMESCNVVRSFDRMLEQLDREFGVDAR
ncbi:MAG: hypothetical protein RL591_1200 [Planctomycetota bacterium]